MCQVGGECPPQTTSQELRQAGSPPGSDVNVDMLAHPSPGAGGELKVQHRLQGAAPQRGLEV